MVKTNNTITIEHVLVGIHREETPVMCNGKATKRTKKIWVREYADVLATGYVIEGHIVYLLDIDMENETYVRVYREDGTRLTAMCQFGCYGKTDHEKTVIYSKDSKMLICLTEGYEGPCGVGHGVFIKRINW